MEPTAMIDPITENDLTAYVDGQLDALRRLDVESFWRATPRPPRCHGRTVRPRRPCVRPSRSCPARAPSATGRPPGPRPVARLAPVRRPPAPGCRHRPPGRDGLAGAFGRPLPRRARHLRLARDPALVADARHAREAAQVRSRIASQRALAGSYDRDGIRAATGIALPALPADWTCARRADRAARTGAGVEVVIDAGRWCARSRSSPRAAPRPMSRRARSRARARGDHLLDLGPHAYALSGARDQVGLANAARQLAGYDAAKL